MTRQRFAVGMAVGAAIVAAAALATPPRQSDELEWAALVEDKLQERCDWEACAIHLCREGDDCIQLTEYRY